MDGKQVAWTSTMSSFMLDHLCNVVASGIRTSSGFKKAQLQACANAMNNHLKTNLTGAQIGNHNRTWRRKWAKICQLKTKSGAGWDEEKCMIVLDNEHYTNHIAVYANFIEFIHFKQLLM